MKKFLTITNIFVCAVLALVSCGESLAYVNYKFPDGYYGYNANRGENYLQITQIEKALFSRTYERESIYNRLNRIERKLFRTTNTNDSLADRLDAITKNINPSLMANVPMAELRRLEQKILRQTYTSDDVENRLARLESVVFGATQSGAFDTRFQRLKIAMRQNASHQPFCTNQRDFYDAATLPTSARAKNILNNFVNGLGTITGFTPPVYDPFSDGGFSNNNWGQSRFYSDNNRFYNSFQGYNTGSRVQILD